MVKSVNAHCSCSSKHKGSLSSAKGLFEKREFRQLAKKKKRMPNCPSLLFCAVVENEHCCRVATQGWRSLGVRPTSWPPTSRTCSSMDPSMRYQLPCSTFRSCQASHYSGAVRQVIVQELSGKLLVLLLQF